MVTYTFYRRNTLSVLKVETICFLETLVAAYKSTRRYQLQGRCCHVQYREDIKCHTALVLSNISIKCTAGRLQHTYLNIYPPLPQKLNVCPSSDIFPSREEVNLLDVFLWTLAFDISNNLHQGKVSSF
jgi:hypothetical protein